MLLLIFEVNDDECCNEYVAIEEKCEDAQTMRNIMTNKKKNNNKKKKIKLSESQ